MGKPIDITDKIRSTIDRYRMIMPGDKIIVAVSGGPDSICLLDILNLLSKKLDLSLVAAHYDHGLRKGEDEIETKLAKNIAASIDIPYEVEKAPEGLKDSPSLEELARVARYNFLEKIRIKHGAQKIATGHTLNDQTETILMRFLRGSGLSGLAGIPPVRDNIIIRPLIEITRNEILDYLKVRGLPFAVDSSNNNRKHLRNRIRLELMPSLMEYQPRLLEHLGIFSNIVRDEDAFMESMASEWIQRELKKTDHETISVGISSVQQLADPLKNRVIRNLIKQVRGDVYPLEFDHINSVTRLLNSEHPQCSVDLPHGITVKKSYTSISFSLKSYEDRNGFCYPLKGTGQYLLDAIGQGLTLEEMDTNVDLHTEGDPSTAHLDADKLDFPLLARNFRPGDRFIPLGMKGHKKLKNFFIDLKVPTEKRASTPILISGDQIVWVCGYRIDERFKVTAETKKIIRATLSPVA